MTPLQTKKVFHHLQNALGPIVGHLAFKTVCEALDHKVSDDEVKAMLQRRSEVLAEEHGKKKDK